MVAYNFLAQFIKPIRRRIKKQTIRRCGKRRHARVGEVVQIYTGQRTTNCFKIIPDQECVNNQPLRIILGGRVGSMQVMIGEPEIVLTSREVDQLAIEDGFVADDNFTARMRMWQHFKRNNPGESDLDCRLIKWDTPVGSLL